MRREIDASAMAKELTADTPEGRELAVKLTALRTALRAMEKAMAAHEASFEECRIQEKEAHQAETFHEEPGEELLDEEMDDDKRGDPEPSGPRAEAERSRNLDRSFCNIYIILSFPTREQHAHSVQNARLRFSKLNQSYTC